MRKADIQQGGFYIGGKWDERIREVLVFQPDFQVDWRDIDPDSISPLSYGMPRGSCAPKTFAAWAIRKAEPDEVRTTLANAAKRAQIRG